MLCGLEPANRAFESVPSATQPANANKTTAKVFFILM